jgi:hypothetical protein
MDPGTMMMPPSNIGQPRPGNLEAQFLTDFPSQRVFSQLAELHGAAERTIESLALHVIASGSNEDARPVTKYADRDRTNGRGYTLIQNMHAN